MEIATKAGLTIICYAAVFLLLFHLFRKHTNRWIAVFLSAALAVPCALAWYGFSPQTYLDESRELLSRISGRVWQIVGGAVLACLTLPICYRMLPKGYVQFWKIFGPSLEYQYQYIAVGQTLVGMIVAYFAWVGTDVAFLFLSITLSALSVVEYSRLMPLQKPLVSEVAKEWMEPATVGRWKIYLPGFLFLLGCMLVVSILPDSALPSILILSISDSLAALVNVKFGRHRFPFRSGESLEGTALFFVASACILILLRFPTVQALLVSAGVTLVEVISSTGLDNLTVPLSTALLLRVLS